MRSFPYPLSQASVLKTNRWFYPCSQSSLSFTQPSSPPLFLHEIVLHCSGFVLTRSLAKIDTLESCPLMETEGMVTGDILVRSQISVLPSYWFSCWQLDPRAAGSQLFCLSSQHIRLVYICAFCV